MPFFIVYYYFKISIMKRFIFLLIVISVTGVYAQNNMHWRAVYQYKRILKEKEKARRDSLLKAQPAMADMMKRFYKRFDDRTFFLDFTTHESVYKEKQKLSKPGGRFSMSGQDRLLYKNLNEKIYVEKKPLFQEIYRIIDTLPDYKWKITGETKKIGNYTVIKAVGKEKVQRLKPSPKDKQKDELEWEEKEKELVAWFTPEIPIQNGPSKYWGLPGLIMQLDKDGEVYLLKELIVNPTKYNPIKKPEKGKKITEKEMKKIRRKQLRKMNKMYKNRRNDKNSRTIRITM
jgi:GLPGLI family protein